MTDPSLGPTVCKMDFEFLRHGPQRCLELNGFLRVFVDAFERRHSDILQFDQPC